MVDNKVNLQVNEVYLEVKHLGKAIHTVDCFIIIRILIVITPSGQYINSVALYK